MRWCRSSIAVALLVMIVTGRTALPAPRQTTTGAWPARGLASADTATAAVGDPRQASTRLMWLPFGTSPDQASPILPSMCSRSSMCTREPTRPHRLCATGTGRDGCG